MADSDKNILISPQRGSATLSPTITFTGKGNDPITLRVTDADTGTLSFEGTEGQLFGISNSLSSGTIFSANYISGIPAIDVDASGRIRFAPLVGTVGIGTTSVTAGNILDVKGNTKIDGNLLVTGTTTLSSLDANTLDGLDSSQFLRSDISATNSVDLRAPIFYQSGDTNSFWNANDFALRGDNPTITLRDTNHNSAYIHVNSSIFYILRAGTDSATGSWTTTNGAWPLEIDLTNNDTRFGRSISSVGTQNVIKFAGPWRDDGVTNLNESYNYLIRGDNDGGVRAVHYINSTTRTADGGANTYTIRNDGGALNLGSYAYPTNIFGSANLINGNTAWHAGNDGSGSGLDADLLDGINSSSFLRSDANNTATGLITFQNSSDYQIILSGNSTTWAGILFADQFGNDTLYYNGQNSTFSIGGGGANVAGKKLHVNGGLTVGSSVDGKAMPTNGIYSEGPIGALNTQWMAVAHYSYAGNSTGAIVINLPGTPGTNYSMPVIKITTYEYNSNAGTTYTISGHNWSTGGFAWYYTRCQVNGGPSRGIRLGRSGTNYVIVLGDTGTSWSYIGVTVSVEHHPSYYATAQDFNGTWTTTLTADLTAYTLSSDLTITDWHSGNDGAGSGLDADLWDGYQLSTRPNWASNSAGNIVVGQLSWKNYGDGHTIFDASAGTSPDGTAVNNTNAQLAWSGTYPTLMGWNGANTFGVRVDSARNAETVAGLSATPTNTASTIVSRDSGGSFSTYNVTAFGGIHLRRDNAAYTGISWYSPTYTAWTTYMSPAGATGCGPAYNITAPYGSYVSSWGLRSFIENNAGFGWTFESGTSTGQPSVVAEIRSSDGLAAFSGGLRTLEQVRATGWWNTPTGSSYSGLGVEMGVSSGSGYVLCYNRDAGTYGQLNIQGAGTNIQLPATGSTITVSGNISQNYGGSYHRIAYSSSDNSYSSTLWWNGLALGNNGENYIVAGRTSVGGSLKFYVNNTNDITSNATPGGTLALTLASTAEATFSSSVTVGGPIFRSVAGTSGYLNGNYSSVESSSTPGTIYTIGGSYVPTATTLGTMYGIGYGHSGYAGIGNPGGVPSNVWGMYVASGGTARIFLDSDYGRGFFNANVTASGGFYSPGEVGFYSSYFANNVRNPIWRFANSDAYGLSFFQGSAGVSPAGGGDTIGFHFGTATAAASLLQLNSGHGAVVNGNFIATGNVGIGTNNPSAKFVVDGGGTSSIALRDDSIENHKSDSDSAAIVLNYAGLNGGASRFRDVAIYNGKYGFISIFDGSTGNVGIGTTGPLQKLDVRGKFLLAADATTSTHITQVPYTINNGTLSWEGSAGQLFSITNNLTSGSIFSVNDVSGLPSIDVDADGTIELAPYGGTVVLKQVTETVANAFNTALNSLSGTLIVDTSTGTVILGDLNASVTTWAFTNVPTANSKSTTITLIIDGDTAQTYGDACSVNGSAISGGVRWSGDSLPIATNNFDILTFTIVKDSAGTIYVFGSANTNFS